MTDEAFDELWRRRNGAMLIVTVAAPAGEGEVAAPAGEGEVAAPAGEGEVERSGCMVGFATQCSIEPRRFLVCLSVLNHTTALAASVDHLGVHAIPADRFDLAELFGGSTADDGVDKLAGVRWHDGPHGVPILDECPDRFVGTVLERIPLGDHVGYLLRPDDVEVDALGEDRDYVRLDRAAGIDPGHPA